MRFSMVVVFLALAAAVASAEPLPYKVAANGGLNMRATPATSGAIVVLVPDGAEITVNEWVGPEMHAGGKAGRWASASYSAGGRVWTGFLFGGFLVPAPRAGGADAKVRWTRVRDGAVLHERPDAEAKEITRIPYNERITVLERTAEAAVYQGRYGRWLKAAWKETAGWVFEACTGDAPRTAYRWVADHEGKDLLDQPSTAGTAVCRTAGFAKLTVTEWQARESTLAGRRGRWFKASWEGKTGWIFEGTTSSFPPGPAMTRDFLVGRWTMDDPGKPFTGPPSGILVLAADGTFDFSQMGGGVKGRWSWGDEFGILKVTDAVSMGGTLTRSLPPQRFQLLGPEGYDKLELRNAADKPDLHLGTLWRVSED